MMDTYKVAANPLAPCSWRDDLERMVEEFVYTRECFFYEAGRAPVRSRAHGSPLHIL